MPELTRRGLMGATVALAAAAALPGGAAATEKPQPIGRDERADRLRRAQQRIQVLGIGAMLIEPGASLDYFTGVQWWRSERLTAAVVPASGAPIIVTPFFERPSVAESLKVE